MIQTNKDLEALQTRGLSQNELDAQIRQIQRGMLPIHLIRPCTLEDGIDPLLPTDENLQRFSAALHEGRVAKFIPASGAATRMFKDCLEFLEKQDVNTRNEDPPISLPDSLQSVINEIKKFPFTPLLSSYFQEQQVDLESLLETRDFRTIFTALLMSPGLGLAQKPKALLPFHQYPQHTRSALEEHLEEALHYRSDGKGTITLHLTVSPQFMEMVRETLDRLRANSSGKFDHVPILVSPQKPRTDTIALTETGEPFRTNEGNLLFRPGGHGALLENLNECQGDILLISNIDNVVPDRLKQPIVETRMQLTGILLQIQDQIFHFLNRLASSTTHSQIIDEAEGFIRDGLNLPFPSSYFESNPRRRQDILFQLLNRPLRVCGVVSNTGDPGGGPFWVRDPEGHTSRQIVEQSQVDTSSDQQQTIFKSATHFNPVDMVCGIRDYQGQPFDLISFVNQQTGFISHKTYEGRPLQALEWPGLWNGGMAHWITLFIEIPRSTFNPVKTFLDWLHPNHQVQT